MAPSFTDIPSLPKHAWLPIQAHDRFNFILRLFSFCTRQISFTSSRGCFCVPMHGHHVKLRKEVSGVCLSVCGWDECLEMLTSGAELQSIDLCAIIAGITVSLWCACWEAREPIFAVGPPGPMFECQPGVSNCHIMQGNLGAMPYLGHSHKQVLGCLLW